MCAGGDSMTYRELDDVADRLAWLLAGHGVGPGKVVALLLPRSPRAIAAILAVLKTGATYLPIDPGLPASRIRFMLTDAAPVATITSGGTAGRIEEFAGLVIDVDHPHPGQDPVAKLPVPKPEDIAYVIYTSGTTGVPKGWPYRIAA